MMMTAVIIVTHLSMNRPDLLRHVTRQVRVVEGKHIELIGVSDHPPSRIARLFVWVCDAAQEIVVVGDVQGVFGLAIDNHVLAKGQAFDLGGDHVAIDASGIELGDKVEKLRFGHRIAGQVATDVGDILRTIEIDQEQLLDLGRRCHVGQQRGVGQTIAVTLVHQELVVVDRDDFTGAGTVGELIGIFVGYAGADIDGHDTDAFLFILLSI